MRLSGQADPTPHTPISSTTASPLDPLPLSDRSPASDEEIDWSAIPVSEIGAVAAQNREAYARILEEVKASMAKMKDDLLAGTPNLLADAATIRNGFKQLRTIELTSNRMIVALLGRFLEINGSIEEKQAELSEKEHRLKEIDQEIDELQALRDIAPS